MTDTREMVDVDVLHVICRQHFDSSSVIAAAESLEKHGQRRPIGVTRMGGIAYGEVTWRAARMLGWREVWVRQVDGGAVPLMDSAAVAKPIRVTPDMRKTIDMAIDKVKRVVHGDSVGITDGRAVELICADYLAGEERG